MDKCRDERNVCWSMYTWWIPYYSSQEKSRVRYTAHTARDVSKTTVVVHIVFFFYFFVGCLPLNFKQPIGAPKKSFLDSSRHLTRHVPSSIYVLHLILFKYGYHKNYWLFLEEFPFSASFLSLHGVRYDYQPPSAVLALSLNHQIHQGFLASTLLGTGYMSMKPSGLMVVWSLEMEAFTPGECNADIGFENKPSKKESNLPTIIFQGQC